MLSTRGAERGWIPQARGRGRAGRSRAETDVRRKRLRISSNEEQDQLSQPRKTGFRDRRATESAVLTGANTELIPRQELEVAADTLGEEEVETDRDMEQETEAEEGEDMEDPLVGMRLGLQSQQQLS